MTEQDLDDVEPHFSDNVEERRFEARVGGGLAGFMTYSHHGDRYTLIHTETAEEFAGRGIAGALAGWVLDFVAGRGAKAIPMCPYVAGYIRRHHEYLHLVPSADRERFELPAD